MVQRKVIVRGATNQALDELDASDIPDLSASYDAAGTAGTHVADTSAAHAASSIGFTPNGSIASTDVQAAIQEVRDEASGSGIPATIVDVKGDLIVATAADTVDRLAAGADDTILMADAAAGTGLKWVAPATPSTQAFGDAAAAGTGDTFTRGDHKHAMPADPVTAHAAASDPHTGYRLESASILPADLDVTADNTTADATTGHHGLLLKLGGGSTNFLRADGTWAAPSGSGAPASVDYLVGTADGGLSGEIVVGTTPGGELGGTWASPTVDATHSGSAHHTQSHDHSAAGDGQTLTPVNLNVPQSTPGTTEGRIGWDTTGKITSAYDTQRARGVGQVGWNVYAYPINFSQLAALTTASALAANGGSVAIPMAVIGHMLFDGVTVRNTDTTLARTWDWDLYVEDLNNGNAGENSVRRVCASAGPESFTAAAASTRGILAAGAPVYLAPGIYWLVIQNQHATNTFGMATTAGAAAFGPGGPNATKTTTNPNGATLDLVAATWTQNRSIYAAWLRGRVLGQTAQF